MLIRLQNGDHVDPTLVQMVEARPGNNTGPFRDDPIPPHLRLILANHGSREIFCETFDDARRLRDEIAGQVAAALAAREGQ